MPDTILGMGRVLLLFLLTPLAFGQSADTTLTQTLINEIRALRQELEATNVTSQRVQIALYRLQSQTAIVNIAQQRLDAARTRTAEIQNQRRGIASQLQLMEEESRNATDPGKRKEATDGMSRFKAAVDSIAAEEAVRRGAEADAEAQLRSEQARLSDLQSLLDRLDRALDDLARTKK